MIHKYIYFLIITSVDTEMCCPKGKCGCQHFILLTLEKKSMGTEVLDFFNKKIILDYYFCLKSGPVFLFQISYENHYYMYHTDYEILS